jgi:hypothetical protein
MAFCCRSRRAVLYAVLAAGFALLTVLPWLVLVLSAHGIEPLLRGAGAHVTAPSWIRLIARGPSWLGPIDPILPAAVLGLAMSIGRRRWLLPTWLAALLIVPGGDDRFAALIWAVLAGQAFVFVYDALRRPSGNLAWAFGASGLALFALVAGYHQFQPIDPAAVAVQSAPVPNGPDDPSVEWWPVLTGRSSDVVYFGYEWTDQWNGRLKAYMAAARGGH